MHRLSTLSYNAMCNVERKIRRLKFQFGCSQYLEE